MHSRKRPVPHGFPLYDKTFALKLEIEKKRKGWPLIGADGTSDNRTWLKY